MVDLPRRKVIGAAAAVWGLSWTDQLKMYLGKKPKSEDDKEDGDRYPKCERIKNLPGAGTAHQTGPHCTEVKIGVYPHEGKPVSLEINTGVFSTATGLDPDEARELATTLENATDEVDNWREKHDYSLPLDGLRRKE